MFLSVSVFVLFFCLFVSVLLALLFIYILFLAAARKSFFRFLAA